MKSFAYAKAGVLRGTAAREVCEKSPKIFILFVRNSSCKCRIKCVIMMLDKYTRKCLRTGKIRNAQASKVQFMKGMRL